MRVLKSHVGRPLDFLGFDGITYNGRVTGIRHGRWLKFVYHVPGVGEVTGVLDLRIHRGRVTIF